MLLQDAPFMSQHVGLARSISWTYRHGPMRPSGGHGCVEFLRTTFFVCAGLSSPSGCEWCGRRQGGAPGGLHTGRLSTPLLLECVVVGALRAQGGSRSQRVAGCASAGGGGAAPAYTTDGQDGGRASAPGAYGCGTVLHASRLQRHRCPPPLLPPLQGSGAPRPDVQGPLRAPFPPQTLVMMTFLGFTTLT